MYVCIYCCYCVDVVCVAVAVVVAAGFIRARTIYING